MWDFDRAAIGSLEDLQREWSGLDAERAKVEEKLRSMDAAARERAVAGGWRHGGGGGRGDFRSATGRGDVGSASDRGGKGGQSGEVGAGARGIENNRLRGGDTPRPLDVPQQLRAAREKHRKMNRTWERGLDPDTAADESFGDDDVYRPPHRGGDDRRAERTTQGGRGLGGGGDIGSTRRNGCDDLGNRLRNGSTGIIRPNVVGLGRRQHGDHDVDPINEEPGAKRPRITSTIVVPRSVEDRVIDTTIKAPDEDGELDRWNAETGGDSVEVKGNARTREEDKDGDDAEVISQQAQQRFGGGKIVLVSSTARGRRSAREEKFLERASDRFRNGSGSSRGVPGTGGSAVGIRGSLASRLGPVVGSPGVVDAGNGRWRGDGGAEGEEAANMPGMVVEPRPMVEPSKPELQAAYKDGDTKKRNRRIFGGLMAHLGSARQRLEVDKNLIEKQQTLAETAAVRQRNEKRLQRQRAAEAARQAREQELVKRDEINARQQKTFIALYSNAFISNQEQLKNSIFTKALPRLAWRPNEHTDATQALVDASNRELDKRIEERKQADDEAFKKIDAEVVQKAAHRTSRRNNAMGNRDGPGGRRVGRDFKSHGDGGGRPGGKPWSRLADREAPAREKEEEEEEGKVRDVIEAHDGEEVGGYSNDHVKAGNDETVDDADDAVHSNGDMVTDLVDYINDGFDANDQGVGTDHVAGDIDETTDHDGISQVVDGIVPAEGEVETLGCKDAMADTGTGVSDANGIMSADEDPQPTSNEDIAPETNQNSQSQEDQVQTAMVEDLADGD